MTDFTLGNTIHPTAIIGPNVVMGTGNYIGPYCILEGHTTLGDNNRFEAFVSVGAPGEHRDFLTYSEGQLTIGDGNTFREHATVQAGTTGHTRIGDRNMILRSSYVAHDTILEDDIVLTCDALVGGHSYLMRGCYLGLGVKCHQFSVIGAYALIGMGGVVPKRRDVFPGKIYIGHPIVELKDNIIGLERAGVTPEMLQAYVVAFQELKKSKSGFIR